MLSKSFLAHAPARNRNGKFLVELKSDYDLEHDYEHDLSMWEGPFVS